MTTNNGDDRQLLGEATIGRTVYKVYRLREPGDGAKRAGMRAHFALEGPRGALWFVTDYGPKYLLNSIAMGGGQFGNRVAPRPLRGLTRAHLAEFLPAEPCARHTLCADDIVRPCILPAGHDGWHQTEGDRS